MWVKVCGIRLRRDAEVAVAAGADAIGFVLAESPRRIDPESARAIGAGLDVDRVLVTVDARPDEVMEMVQRAGATGVQPHGRHALEVGDVAVAAGLLVLHPVPVRSDLEPAMLPHDRILLFDTYRREVHGGTGATFDWAVLDGIERDFVLAGGLTPDNVAGAVRRVRPWGVDASSGLESAPGEKDPERIRAFVMEAKHA